MSTKAKWRNGILTFYDSITGETVSPMAPVRLRDDFLHGVVDTGLWTEVEVGDSTKAISGGVLTYHLHATAETEEAGLYGRDDKCWNLDKGLIFECRMAIHVAPTLAAEVMIGVQNDSYGAGSNRILNADECSIYSAFGFYATLGVGLIPAIRTDDGTLGSGIVSSGLASLVLDAYHIYRIDFTDVSDVKFYVDGVAVATGTTFNMSTGSGVLVQPIVMAQKNGANAGLADIYIDYIQMWQASR